MEFHIVLNPAGASGKARMTWEEIEPVLVSRGCRYTVHTSTEKESIGDICRKLSSTGEQVNIIMIGGDGSSNEAVNGIADFANTRIGFVPCGTGNDLQRDMGIPKDRKKLVEKMLDGEIKRTSDIGELTIFDGKKPIKRRFNISCDVGFGAATCAFANNSRIKPILNYLGIGRAIYLIEAVRVCFTSESNVVTISCGGKKRVYKKCLCAIGMNHQHEGGGFRFCPNADFSDGKLDMVIGNGLSHLEFLRMLPLAYMGKHLKLKGIYSERAEEIYIKSRHPIWVHTDGEVMGMVRKVRMRILPEKLNLLF